MAVTRRQMEFLRIIKDVCDTTKFPVHYERVAELMGISKWSAYEMLKVLEEKGLLTSQYLIEQDKKYPGRARVVFEPTQIAARILAGEAVPEAVKPGREIDVLKARIISCYDKNARTSPAELVEQMKNEMPSIENPLLFCAYMLAILILHLHCMSQIRVSRLKELTSELVQGEMGLAMFVGAAIGIIAKTATPIHILSHITESLPAFQRNLARLNQIDQARLKEFVGETLAMAT